MKINLDLKTLITIVTFAAMIGGFYYTTQSRLDDLESSVVKLGKQVKRLTKNKGFNRDYNKHQFFNLKSLLKWKKTMNRDKDQDDIKLIKKLLK